jgi:hypothetical protein
VRSVALHVAPHLLVALDLGISEDVLYEKMLRLIILNGLQVQPAPDYGVLPLSS